MTQPETLEPHTTTTMHAIKNDAVAVTSQASLQWLQKASAVVAPAPAEAPSVSGEMVYRYILIPLENITQLGQFMHGFTLKIMVSRIRKNGAPSKERAAARSDYYHLRFSKKNCDQAVFRALSNFLNLKADYDNYDSYYNFSNELKIEQTACSVLSAVVKSGTCYLSDDTQPLRWAAKRHASLLWEVDIDARQRLRIDIENASLVIADESMSCFIDIERHTAGHLLLDFPEALLQHVQAAPALSQAEVEPFCAALPATLRQLLPMPRTYQEVVQAVTPEPLLYVTRSSELQTKLQAEVAFAYGPRVISGGDPDLKSVSAVEGEHLVCMPRQFAFEQACLAQLQTHGLTSLPNETAEPDALQIFTLDAGSDLQACYSAIERVFKPLEAQGWRLVGLQELSNQVIHVDAAWDVDVAEEADENAWFSLNMGIEIDGKRENMLPVLLSALKDPAIGLDPEKIRQNPQANVYVPLDNERVLSLPKERLLRVMEIVHELFTGGPRLGVGQAMALLELADTGVCRLHGSAFMLHLAQQLRACEGVALVQPPASLQATLRPYQQQGLSWLQCLREHNLAGLLADDMGLGKTLQTLAHIVLEKEAGRLTTPALVVVPTSLLFNWQNEINQFAPHLRVLQFYGLQRRAEQAKIGSVDVVLTTYGVLMRDVALHQKQHYHLIILDESQAIKNPRSQIHKAVRALEGTHRLCLSGTPMQNHLEELWAQFAFLQPHLLESHKVFQKEFRTPIEKHQDTSKRQQLARRLRPFLLRRSKAQVTQELPRKTEIIESIVLETLQRDLYETVRVTLDERVRQAVAVRGMASASIIVLDALLKLRQVCCDPRLVKLQAAKRVTSSAKLNHLMTLLPSMLEAGRKVLIFSQFTSMLELIGATLQTQRIAYSLLTGQTHDRQAAVETFQSGSVSVFLISLKAGGTGLNLTQADTVILYDPWWNPAVEAQAIDRTHRIGQDKPVFVHKLIVKGSVEEKILALQERKKRLNDAVLGSGKWADLFTRDDLDGLFAPMT